MIGSEHERAQRPTGPGFGDAVTFSFADLSAERYGSARIGITAGDPPQASALALLFAGRDPVAAVAEGGVAVPGGGWERVEAAGVRAEVIEPLSRWRVAFASAEAGYELDFTAVSAPAEITAEDPAGRAAGQQGYEQVCRVEGTVTVGETTSRLVCLGQRGHGWGVTDWDSIELARTITAWLHEGDAVTLSAVRPQGAGTHADEAVSAFLFAAGDDGPAQATRVEKPRLSTTYDADGRQRRAGLELWMGADDELPRRIAGEALGGSTLELGRLSLQCAFFRWSMAGRGGVGRYDIVRRT